MSITDTEADVMMLASKSSTGNYEEENDVNMVNNSKVAIRFVKSLNAFCIGTISESRLHSARTDNIIVHRYWCSDAERSQ